MTAAVEQLRDKEEQAIVEREASLGSSTVSVQKYRHIVGNVPNSVFLFGGPVLCLESLHN